jgi:hypothetical protein
MKIARKLEINVGKELKARDIGNLGMRAFTSLTSENRGLELDIGKQKIKA